MFSSNNSKLLGLQNEYIDRINRNALKLNKQLQFFMNLQHQIGGAGAGASASVNTENVVSPIERMQFDQLYAETLAAETKGKLEQLQQRVNNITPTLERLQNNSRNFIKILDDINAQIENVKPGQLKSYDDTKLNEMREKIPESMKKLESKGVLRSDKDYGSQLLQELLSTDVEDVKSEQATEKKDSGVTVEKKGSDSSDETGTTKETKGSKIRDAGNTLIQGKKLTEAIKSSQKDTRRDKEQDRVNKELEAMKIKQSLEKDKFEGETSYNIMTKALQEAGKIEDGKPGSFKNKIRDLQRYDAWAKKPDNRSYNQKKTQMKELKTYYQDLNQ